MIYEKCLRCRIKLRRSYLKHKRLSMGGGKLINKKYTLCNNHFGTKSIMEAIWGDYITNLLPDSFLS